MERFATDHDSVSDTKPQAAILDAFTIVWYPVPLLNDPGTGGTGYGEGWGVVG